MVPKKRTESPHETNAREEEMTIEITCPNCNFSKIIPKEKIPAGVRWANCPRCKNRFEFVAQYPAFGFEREQKGSEPEKEVRRQISPWENRSELGIWQGLYQTFKAVLFSPEKLFKSMTVTGGIREPLAYGLLFGSMGTMFDFFWQFLIIGGSLRSIDQGLIGQLPMGFIFLIIMLISPVFVILTIFFTSGIMHLMLLIVGAKNGFEATFRVISYSQATQVLGLIPFIGGLIGGFWLFIVQFIGLRAIHEISYLKVLMAFLIPVVVLILLMVIFISISLSIIF